MDKSTTERLLGSLEAKVTALSDQFADLRAKVHQHSIVLGILFIALFGGEKALEYVPAVIKLVTGMPAVAAVLGSP